MPEQPHRPKPAPDPLSRIESAVAAVECALNGLTNEIRHIHDLLQQIYEILTAAPNVTSFTIEQGVPMFPIAPGFSPVFTATPVPATSVPSTPPTWTTSDTVNAPITTDATGLITTVAIPATAVVGTSVTLTVSYANADSTVATGSLTITIVAPPSPDITSFTIAQTA